MNSNRRIYWILSCLTLGSYVWVGYNLLHTHADQLGGTVCLIKSTTGIPCPSCGITRSVLTMLQGDFQLALWINPLGFLAVMTLVVIPVWIVLDVVRNSYSLINVYNRAEDILHKQKLISMPLIALVVLNWIWNISKGL